MNLGSETGIHLRAHNKTHTVEMYLDIPSDCFDNYKCDSKMTFCLHLSSLITALNCMNGEKTLRLRASDDSAVLSLLFASRFPYQASEIDLKTIEINQDCIEIPVQFFFKYLL